MFVTNHSNSFQHVTDSKFSNRFIPLNRRNGGCPICQKDNGDCRQHGELILCMTEHGETNHPEYQYAKESRDGLWGVHKPRRDNNWDKDAWLESCQKNSKQKQKQEQREALPVAEIDRIYRALCERNRLDDNARKDLTRRGINPDTYLGFSVNKGNMALDAIPGDKYLFPGVGANGQLYYSGNGYATPSYSFDGEINGYQVRYETTDNKYRWQVGSHNHIKVGDSYELPITHHGMINVGGVLYCAEGFTKTLIAHERHGISILGAAGGNFASSKNQVKEAIERFRPKEIRIIPDGGAVANKNVLCTLRATYQLVKSLAPKTPITFTWWGQVAKSDGDIDEIDVATFTRAVNLSAKDFFTLAGQDDHEYQKHQQTHKYLDEPDADDYKAYCAWLDEQELIDELEADLRLQESIESAIDYALANSNSDETKEDDNQKPEKDVDYWFKPGERHSAIARGHAKGYKYVLDLSTTGTGKDYDNARRVADAPIQTGEKDDRGNKKVINPKIWYLDQDYKNKDSEFDSWDILVPRHGGMYHDPNRKLVDGKPYVTTKKPEGVEVEPEFGGNCNRPGMFGALVNLGYERSGGKNSPICSRCILYYDCKSKKEGSHNGINEDEVMAEQEGKTIIDEMEGDTGNYGYLAHRVATLKNSFRILAHPKSLPRLGGETPYDYSHDSIIVNEAGDLLAAKKHRKINQTEWAKALALALTTPDLEPEQKDLLCQLNSIVTDWYMTNDLPRHGFDVHDMKARLSELLDKQEVAKTLAKVIDLYFNKELNKLLKEELDTVTKAEAPGVKANARAMARSAYKLEQNRQWFERIKNFPKLFLGDMLTILINETKGNTRFRRGELEVVTRDDTLERIIKLAKKVTLNDSTLTRERCANLLGIKPEEIYVISQVEPSRANLTVNRYGIKGDTSNQWSDNYKTRLKALVDHSRQINPDVQVIVPKKLRDLCNADGYDLGQTRGSNRYSGKSILFKPVMPDIGGIQDDYELEQPNISFDKYYKQRVIDNIIQTIGRSRWHRYKHQIMVNLVLPKTITASDLASRGVDCVDRDILADCEAAAPKKDKQKMGVLRHILKSIKDGVDLSQSAMATALELSQSAISRLFSSLGIKYKQFKALCVSLYKSFIAKRIKYNHANLTDKQKEIMSQLAHWWRLEPEAILKELLELFASKGYKAVEDFWLVDFSPIIVHQLADRLLRYLIFAPPPHGAG